MPNNISWRDKDSSDLHVLRDGEKLRVGVMMRDAARFCVPEAARFGTFRSAVPCVAAVVC
jgi:hypothetical protein